MQKRLNANKSNAVELAYGDFVIKLVPVRRDVVECTLFLLEAGTFMHYRPIRSFNTPVNAVRFDRDALHIIQETLLKYASTEDQQNIRDNTVWHVEQALREIAERPIAST